MTFFIIVVIIVIFVLYIKSQMFYHPTPRPENHAPKSTSLSGIDTMTGYEFERKVAEILKIDGYTNIDVTPKSGDFGADILAWKDGKKYAFQCKRYSKKVGNKAVQEVYTAKAYYHCDYASVVTNNYFTDAAIKTAEQTGVILIDRKELEWMSKPQTSYNQQTSKNFDFPNDKISQRERLKRSLEIAEYYDEKFSLEHYGMRYVTDKFIRIAKSVWSCFDIEVELVCYDDSDEIYSYAKFKPQNLDDAEKMIEHIPDVIKELDEVLIRKCTVSGSDDGILLKLTRKMEV